MIHTLTHPIVHSIVHPVIGYRIPFARKPLSDIILALFANGEQGGFYDPYDLTDEKLAWVADFGEELITNGDFSDGFTGWSDVGSAWSIVPEGALLSASTIVFTTSMHYHNVNSTTPVEISITATDVSGGSFRLLTIGPEGTKTVLSIDSSGTYKFEADYPISSIRILQQSGEPTAIVTNVSVREIPTSAQFMTQFPNHTLFQNSIGTIPVTGHNQPLGLVLDKSGRNNHASQSLSAARPLWQNNNGIKTFYRDGVDDALNVTLPAATYTRIAANTGTGYATNTVVHGGGALNILGTGAGNSAGYILIDRVLTQTEAANVETLFNTRAGL